jgi:hypothetical protein
MARPWRDEVCSGPRDRGCWVYRGQEQLGSLPRDQGPRRADSRAIRTGPMSLKGRSRDEHYVP